MVVAGSILTRMIDRLSVHFGPQNWWPAESAFEVIIGAILTQNTSWKNVEKSILEIKRRNLMSAPALLSLNQESIEQLIRSSGFFRQKARHLRTFLDWFMKRAGGSIEALKEIPHDTLRTELLLLRGIGPETADAILCYALDHPVFVVDAYTKRIFSRHGLINAGDNYEAMQDFAHGNLPLENDYLNEAHALIVAVGKQFCFKRDPDCEACPLSEFLPADGPIS